MNILKEYELWHGSIKGIEFPIKVDYSKNLTDIGQGFYLGENKEQAINRVCELPQSVLYKFKLRIDKECKAYRFTDDVLWALYIAYNRKKKIDFIKYPKLEEIMKQIESSDIIIGNIADDKIAFSYNNFIDGLTTSKVLTESLKLIKYGQQCVVKSSKYVKSEYLELEEEIRLSDEEKEKAKQWGEKIKEKMDGELEEIQSTYRREGKFIDELLEEYNK